MIAPTRKKKVNQVMLLARETFTFAVSGSTENSSVFAPAQIKRQAPAFRLIPSAVARSTRASPFLIHSSSSVDWRCFRRRGVPALSRASFNTSATTYRSLDGVLTSTTDRFRRSRVHFPCSFPSDKRTIWGRLVVAASTGLAHSTVLTP